MIRPGERNRETQNESETINKPKKSLNLTNVPQLNIPPKQLQKPEK